MKLSAINLLIERLWISLEHRVHSSGYASNAHLLFKLVCIGMHDSINCCRFWTLDD